MVIVPRAPLARVTGLAALLMLVGVACSSDEPDRSIARYCAEVQANLATINTPAISTSADIAATLQLYNSIGDSAPAAVQPEWQTMIDSLQTAATLEPNDPAQVAAVNEAALSSQSAATRIQQYTKDQCGADIGTPPAPTNPVTATTIPPPTTT